MNINISIDGVLRNRILSIIHFYNKEYIDGDVDPENTFPYEISETIENDKLSDSIKFQSNEELEYFLHVEFPLEIYGHAVPSYKSVFNELNDLIYKHKKINFTTIGIDEFGKSKPSSLFFLSKNGFLGNVIKFIKKNEIKKEWRKCDVWVTDDQNIIDQCPKGKKAIKFNTNYNKHFTHEHEINNLEQINEICLKYLEKPTDSILMQ